MNIFEQTARLKLRFSSPQGALTVEDLWDLPLTSTVEGKANLDDIAMNLHRGLKDASDVHSFVVEVEEPKDTIMQLQFNVVRHVIEAKKDENRAARMARETRERKQQLLEIISKKEDEELQGLSVSKLKSMIEKL
jgi:hypothetical protein